jgi:hypothetical protein
MVFSMSGTAMPKSEESAAFAELLAIVFPTAEERARHERQVAELVASRDGYH